MESEEGHLLINQVPGPLNLLYERDQVVLDPLHLVRRDELPFIGLVLLPLVGGAFTLHLGVPATVGLKIIVL